ncbi:MAG: hypothetical protein LAT64_07955 [Phycisphaerales bacterium]|nr:hypothetical protein [Planctomycetota bacterium]MCH8508688.1 hypothetical protein [Phycisphaerales bacterium]
MHMSIALLGLAVIAAPAAITQAQSLTTNAPTAGLAGNPTSGIFLDLTADAAGPGLFVTQFDMSIWSGDGTHTFELWTKPGTYVGFDGNPGPWTLHDSFTVNGVADPVNNPISFVLNNPLALMAGETQGVYLVMLSGGVRYTSGSPQTFFSNDDLSLFSDLGQSGTGPFVGNNFTPRAFAGTVYYTPIPAPATAGLFALAAGLIQRRRAR